MSHQYAENNQGSQANFKKCQMGFSFAMLVEGSSESDTGN
jgi:hypothetical protein